MSALADVAARERIPCEFERRATYDVFLRAADARAVQAALRTCRERGDAWAAEGLAGRTWVPEETAESTTGVRGARGAVDIGTCCSMWPYKLVMGLLERAVARSAGRLNVQTETPVLGVQRRDDDDDGEWTVVRTDRGVVRARKVVFATNAYTAALLPEYRGIITPYKGVAAHLAASDGREPVAPHLSHTYNLDFGGGPRLDKVDYLNPRPDGGVVLGGGKWIFQEKRELWYDTVDDSTLIDPLMKAKYFDGYMQKNFAGWEDSGLETEKVWTGSMFNPALDKPNRLIMMADIFFLFFFVTTQSKARLQTGFRISERSQESRTSGSSPDSMVAATHSPSSVPRQWPRWRCKTWLWETPAWTSRPSSRRRSSVSEFSPVRAWQ